MSNVKTQDEQLRREEITEQVSKTEQFFSENSKKIWIAVAAVVAVGLVVLGYFKLVYGPACDEARAVMFPSEAAFQAGNYEIALNGDGDHDGFAAICSRYGAKAGQSVYLYAAACAAQLGQWEDALAYAGKYGGREPILAARALALKGDAYVALEDMAQAAVCYKKAAARADNVFAAAYLVKAGVAYEALGDNAAALACYEQVKDKYPQSIEGYEIDKYISKVSGK